VIADGKCPIRLLAGKGCKNDASLSDDMYDHSPDYQLDILADHVLSKAVLFGRG